MGFRVKKGVHLPAIRQEYVYAISRMYKDLTAEQKATIRQLCEEAAGEYAPALLVLVSTGRGVEGVAMEYHTSKSTLYRALRRYYRRFPVPFV